MKTCEQCHLRYPDESTFCFVDGKALVPMQDPRVGSTLGGRYVIEDVLAEGGMATVYAARHKLVDRPCAIKIMSPGLSRDPVVRERFRREAKAAQKLAHPNIIEIFDQGDTDDGTSYLVMELLEGETLSKTLANEALRLERALPIMVQVARALARAHDFDVIHRDLKPDNIFLCRRADGTDLVKLLDFGIARSLQDARLTGQGEVFGTPQYMAPERITSIDAGAPSDLYSIGVIFFEMLTGQLPFEAPDVPTYFLKHLKEAPPKIRPLAPDTPESLERLVLGLMAKDPVARPVDAHRLRLDLVTISDELGIKTPPEIEMAEPSSRRATVTLPPVALDRWGKRMSVFEQMLLRAYGGSPPAELATMLEQVRSLVGKVEKLRAESVGEQRKLEGLEAQEREGRQRFGFAVDALGVDASKAREEVRAANAALSPLKQAVAEERARVLEAHKEILLWEGRSAFDEPHEELELAYRGGADAVKAWRESHRAARRASQQNDVRERELADLEFQIAELRVGLANFEQNVEREKAAGEQRIAELDASSEALQVDLLSIATRFCAPLRRRPELLPLFQELEADVAA
jgi:tRNA A-37 threonylcarbamoyl transferase component Bud32